SGLRVLILFNLKGEDGRTGLVLDRTVFHPQGGGQPADTGFVAVAGSEVKFVVQDVRSRDGVVYHYGLVENSGEDLGSEFEKGREVVLHVDESRRKLNSRIHSAGYLLDVCRRNVGLGDLKPTKGYHFPQGYDFDFFQSKQKELELEANALISRGGKVLVALVPYEEACKLCGEELPDYITKDSTPRIVKLGNNPGCPCGGTHFSDISEIINSRVSQIRTKKGVTKVFYNGGP
ncbi:uncharacterized protein LOC126792260, partial [Argentina anserina]|uniref:uncharacterized protein LOC126792260 n=1 Tax=Argentina anserina TaxID=57926 RepID=UPI0021762464